MTTAREPDDTKPCEECALTQSEIDRLLAPGWQQDGALISKTYPFKNYCQTMAFVNAVAWIAQQQDHHPDLAVSYGSCRVDYSTHFVGGLSKKDFICAAKIDALLAP